MKSVPMPNTSDISLTATLLATLIGGCRPAPTAVRETLFLEEDGVAVEMIYEQPVSMPRVVAVVLPGGFSPDTLPATGDRLLRQDVGLVQIHVELPGGSGDPTTEGVMDYYGADSRRAVAAALRFAASDIAVEGTTLRERLGVENPLPLILLGRSNGGNLAVGTLADPEVTLPPVDGLVLWETPSGPQFLLLEVRDPERGTCAFSEEDDGGLVCEMNLENLVDSVPPFLDRDGDGVPTEDEPVFEGLLLEEGRLHSPSLLRGLSTDPGRMEVDAAMDWFSFRDASRNASEAVVRHPDMGVIVLGGQEDHAQLLLDSPHVFGLAEAFYDAGAWTRLLPDAVYSGLAWEHAAGEGVSLDNPGTLVPSPYWLTGILSAAVLELGDRAAQGYWEADLKTSLRDSG